jgi:predicted DNA repair protein MutK
VTAGVLADDLALNAQQVSGVRTDRELPVVWAVAKGSLLNKAILVPAALAISAFAPWAVTPLLMIGGLFLCYEGFEKIIHKLGPQAAEDAAHRRELVAALSDPTVDLVELEKQKIKGAVRTDFILSAEIITIALGTVAAAPFTNQVAVLVAIALIMTVGVYGLVAGIVRLDDVGLRLAQRPATTALRRLRRRFGECIVSLAPPLMKFLSIAGTAAMFLVGGGILVHGIPVLHHVVESWGEGAGNVPGIGIVGGTLTRMLLNALAGIAAGAAVYAAIALVKRLRSKRVPSHS